MEKTTSTFEGNLGCIAKAIHIRLYMPVWSLEELQACVFTLSDVEQLYKKWGGSPQCIFVLSRNGINEEKLDNFLHSDSLEKVIAQMDRF